MSDLISRQAVLSTLDFADNALDEERTVEKYKELLVECIKMLPSAENKGEWIPIKTRPLTEEEKEYYEENGAFYFDSIFDCCLPEDGQEILITTKYGTVDKVTFYNEGNDGSYFEGYEDEGEVLAWQPLPEPYKAEKRKKNKGEIRCQKNIFTN